MNTIYTDGSCINNGMEDAKASWAIFHKEKEILLSGLVATKEIQTNNTGELTAVMKAIALLVHLKEKVGEIVTDSKYCIKSLTEWDIEKKVKRARKKNYFLIKEIKNKMTLVNIKFKWVKGHSFNPHNDLVDQKARDELI